MGDMVESISILCAKGEKPDHTVSSQAYSIETQVVIKYVPFVGDSKRTMNEYTSVICMGGHYTIMMDNTCEVNHLYVKESNQMIANPICLYHSIRGC